MHTSCIPCLRNILLLACFALGFTMLSVPIEAIATLQSDVDALLALKNLARPSAPFLANWTGNDPCSAWKGVSCIAGRVASLDLFQEKDNYFVFDGTIPPQLGSLTSLTLLRISNGLSGPIPPELDALVNLDTLDLSNNGLTGVIPPSLVLSLSRLTSLSLANNSLSGPIPPELGSLPNLSLLDLMNNNLTGGIPLELTKLSYLNRLALAGNGLTGTIPPEIERLWENLVSLDLSRNRLSGPIPPQIGRLTELLTLSLASNGLEGGIPPELAGNVSSDDGGLSTSALQSIDLSHNNLSGPVPPAVFLGLFDVAADLSFNSLTGTIPANVSWDPTQANVAGNFFMGVMPPLFPAKGVALNCFAVGDGQRDAAECARTYPEVKCGCAPQELVGISGLCRCVSPLYLRAVFTAAVAESLGNFSANLDSTLQQLAAAAKVTSGQVVLANFSSSSFANSSSPSSTVELAFGVLPLEGLAFNASEADIITRRLNGNSAQVVVPFFEPGYRLTVDAAGSPLPLSPVPANAPSLAPQVAPVLAPSPAPTAKRRTSDHEKNLRIPVVAGTFLAALLATLIAALALWRCISPTVELASGAAPPPAPKSWTLFELRTATNNFDDANLLGSGRFGTVYKGTLVGVPVAVKRLKGGDSQDVDDFTKELMAIGSIQYRHLVTLQGYCLEDEERLLVYDFIPNGSLEDALFKGDVEPALKWGQCMHILVGTARGIAYLHEGAKEKIIHRDIKPSNILLDASFQAKISDFGLAKCGPIVDTLVSTNLSGTMGYLAPEFASTGELSEKSDVYSFGMVMVVVISHHRPHDTFVIGGKTVRLPARVYHLARENQLLELVSQRFADTYNQDEARGVIAVALLCIHPLPEFRPSMSDVLQMLSGHMDIPTFDMRAVDASLPLKGSGLKPTTGAPPAAGPPTLTNRVL